MRMSMIVMCDKCKKEIADEDYIASSFTLNVLRAGVWCCYHGHLCEECKDKFVMWIGMKE